MTAQRGEHPDHETQAEHDAWEAGYEAGMDDGYTVGEHDGYVLGMDAAYADVYRVMSERIQDRKEQEQE